MMDNYLLIVHHLYLIIPAVLPVYGKDIDY